MTEPVATWIVGDALSSIRGLAPRSVNMLLTSPPYFLLRDYLPGGHANKDLELGREPTPGDFLESLLCVMDATWDALTDDGTFWVNLSDTHAGSGGAGGDYNPGGLRDGQPRSEGSAKKKRRSAAAARNGEGGYLRDRQTDEDLGIVQRRLRTRRTIPGYPDDQSVCWLPQLFGASLAYGRNMLTGVEHQRWITRPPITWCKPNPTPGRDGRKFRTATEIIIYGGKRSDHYFDLDSVRRKNKHSDETRRVGNYKAHNGRTSGGDVGRPDKVIRQNPKGAPPFNWWVISSSRYAGAHFATFPPELCVKPILTGCPPGGVVLDPFAGTGTALKVAIELGRNGIGIDLDPRNRDLARERLGLFSSSWAD